MENGILQKESCWYAVLTRARHEKAAASMLGGLGIAHFLPLTTEARRWSDRKQMVSLPLFPGYLFVNIAKSSEILLRVLKVPGVINLVGNGNGPIAVPEQEIDTVRAVLSRGIGCFPHPFLSAGDRVRIVRGPLAGIKGRFLRSGADSKLVISVEMIQRSLAIHIDASDVEAIVSSQGERSIV